MQKAEQSAATLLSAQLCQPLTKLRTEYNVCIIICLESVIRAAPTSSSTCQDSRAASRTNHGPPHLDDDGRCPSEEQGLDRYIGT